MNTDDDMFGRLLATWLDEEAVHRVPDHLGEVLVRTAATRQRPWWSSPERWLPMETFVVPRGVHPRALGWLAVLGALLLTIIGLALWTGSHRAAPALGLGGNGRILVAVDGALRSYAVDGTDPRTISSAVQRGAAGDLAISPDGLRIAIQPADAPGQIDIVSLTDGSTHRLALPPGVNAIEPYSWSADGRQIAFKGTGAAQLYLAAVDGSTVTPVGATTLSSTVVAAKPILSPDGRWIAFEGTQIGGPDVPSLEVMRLDGTGLQSVADLVDMFGSGVASWAPDSTTDRLLYVDLDGGIRVHDVAAGTDAFVAAGKWPVWSPDATKVAYWDDGTIVASIGGSSGAATEPTHPFSGATGRCATDAAIDGNPVCGAVQWSPDGTLVIGYDGAMDTLVIARADGTGIVQRIPLSGATEVRLAWQAIRP